jgi:hypothetical protein
MLAAEHHALARQKPGSRGSSFRRVRHLS